MHSSAQGDAFKGMNTRSSFFLSGRRVKKERMKKGTDCPEKKYNMNHNIKNKTGRKKPDNLHFTMNTE